jgi:hypothetical protein
MADWTELDTNTLLPGEPLTSAKALAFFENPKAIAEGADDAPRNQLKSLPRLVAGSSVRSTRTRTVPTGTTEVILNHGIIQIGTIRASMTGSGAVLLTISRMRNGTSVTLAQTSAASITVDVSVIPGDELIFSGRASASSNTTISATLAVASGDLWPSITGGKLEGNNV